VTSQNRYYSSIAPPTTLAASLAATGNPSVAAITGLPSSFPYSMLIDWGSTIAQGTTGAQEVISVTSAPTGSGPYTVPCTRGVDGTTAVAHNNGAQIVHGVSAQDFNDPISYIGSHWSTAMVGATVNTTTQGPVGTFTIPASDMVAGAGYRFHGVFPVTLTSTSTTIVFSVNIGTTGTNTDAVFEGFASITTQAVAATRVCYMSGEFYCLTTGGSGTVQGTAKINNDIAGTADVIQELINPTATTVTTTSILKVTFQVALGAAHASVVGSEGSIERFI
jgi:hypothetical protein